MKKLPLFVAVLLLLSSNHAFAQSEDATGTGAAAGRESGSNSHGWILGPMAIVLSAAIIGLVVGFSSGGGSSTLGGGSTSHSHSH